MYLPIIKTGEAECRAVMESPFLANNDAIIPIIELTRGRKKSIKLENGKNLVSFPFSNRLNKLKKGFYGDIVAIDLTSDEDLLSEEIYTLYDPKNGYENWCSFIGSIDVEGCFKKIIPSIIFNWNDDKFLENIQLEIVRLTKKFDSVFYRCDLQSTDCYDEIPTILQFLPSGTKLCVLIDAGYLQESIKDDAIALFTSRIENIIKILQGNNYSIAIASTSFPNNVTEYGDLETSTIRQIEKDIFKSVRESHDKLLYSDYATINPIRNDLVTMARGWIPRIDVPVYDSIYYYRHRRPPRMSAYKGTYAYVAGRAISDVRFPNGLDELWGISMIRSCAFGIVPSSAPNFWISVRMNIHLYQTVKWLEELSV